MDTTRVVETALQQAKSLEYAWYRRRYDSLGRWLEGLGESRWREYRDRTLSAFPPPESVLLFKPDEIGDAVHALPALAKLRRWLPNARLYLLCQTATAALYERTGLLDAVVSVPVSKVLLRFPRLSLENALTRLPEKEFDLAVYLRTYPVFFRQFRALPARMKVYPKEPRMRVPGGIEAPTSLVPGRKAHQARQLLEIASFVCGEPVCEEDFAAPAFHWRDEDRRGLERVFGGPPPERFFVVHPFARFETRRYPQEYWQAVVASLRERFSAPVVLVGGKEDGGWDASGGAIPAQGRLSLMESGYLISRASGFIGNESGPAHWAAALGVPTVTFFGGHSHPGEWAPRGSRTLLLHQEGLACAPCHRRVCPGYGVRCLREMKPVDVVPRVLAFLERNLKAPAG